MVINEEEDCEGKGRNIESNKCCPLKGRHLLPKTYGASVQLGCRVDGSLDVGLAAVEAIAACVLA